MTHFIPIAVVRGPAVALFIAFSMALGYAPLCVAQTQTLGNITATQTAPGSITIDGKLDDAAWQSAAPVGDFFEIGPGDRATPKVKTSARVLYDNARIIVGIRADDPNPSAIRAPYTRRDEVKRDQDFVVVFIDPIGARKFAQFVRVNPRGVVADGLFNEDSGNEDFAPDFEVEAAAHIDDAGWSAEIAIPFGQLRYSTPPATQWSIMFFRNYPRDQRYRMSTSPLPRDSNCFLCINHSLLGLTGLPEGISLTITPNITLRTTRDRVDRAPVKRDQEAVVGVDIKLRPRPDLVVDGTINPDFSQVEIDAPQLTGSTQFALFFPEKRPFFLEGADVLEGMLSAVYTRSITNPAWGIRATKRDDRSNATILVAKDDGGGSVLLPGALSTQFARQSFKSYATIARGRYNLTPATTVGGVFTDRTIVRNASGVGGHNRVVGVDWTHKPSGEHRLRSQLLASSTTSRFGNTDLPKNDYAFAADYSYTGDAWYFYGNVNDIGKGFRADNGFFSQVGYRSGNGEVRHRWYKVGPLNELNAYFNWEYKTDTEGRLIYQQTRPGVSAGLARDTFVWFEPRFNDRVRASFANPMKRRDQYLVGFETVPFPWLARLSGEWIWGERHDTANDRIGDGIYANLDFKLRPTDRIEVEYRIDESVIRAKPQDHRGSGPNRILNERAQRLLGVLHLSARDSIRLIYQTSFNKRSPDLYRFSTSAKDQGQTLSLTYAHRQSLGTTLFVGATLGNEAEPDGQYRRRQAELFVKASYSFAR